MRFPAEARRNEGQASVFIAGERLTVASEITGGDETRAGGASRPRSGTLRSVVLAILLLLASIGAVTVYRSLTGFIFR